MTNLPRFGLVALLALATGGRAPAQEVAPVPTPTIITSAPYTISAAGYYQLGANLSYPASGAAAGAIITINANNVTLDFAGHFITGTSTNPATQVTGVYASGHNNLTIQNGTISYCYNGIALLGDNSAATHNINHRVENMLINHCYFQGLVAGAANNSEVTNCRINATGGTTVANAYVAGVYLSGGSGNQISDTSVVNVAAGANQAGYGIVGGDPKDSAVLNSNVSNVTAGSGGSAYGIFNAGFAVGNKVSGTTYGLYNCTKYRDTLTYDCATPFTGGTAVGANQ